jgi:cytochrome P450
MTIGMIFISFINIIILIVYTYKRLKYRQFKGPLPLPLIGNLYDPKSLSIIMYLSSCIRKYGSTFMFWAGFKPMLVVSDPILVRKILTDTTTFVKGPDYTEKFSVVFGEGLVTSNGNKHKEDRKCLGRFFTKTHIANHYRMICEMTDKMITEEIEPQVNKVMNIQDFFHILSLRIFGKFSVGIDYSLPENHDIAIRVNSGVKTGSNIIGKHIILNIPMFDIIPSIKKVKQIVRNVDEHISQIICDRLNIMSKNKSINDDMLDSLLHRYTQENNSELIDVKDQIRTALAAGHDTTAFFGCYMAYLLAKHPEVQEKVRHEVKHLNNISYITDEDVCKLQYCRCVLQEVLRLYTVIPFINRTTTKNYKIDNTDKIIPSNTTVLIPLSIMNRNETIWNEPNSFKPERFMEIPGHNNAKRGYLPFGYGSRSCIGLNLAMSEGMIMMIKLISKYKFYPDPTFKPKIIAGISLISKNGIRVRLEKI